MESHSPVLLLSRRLFPHHQDVHVGTAGGVVAPGPGTEQDGQYGIFGLVQFPGDPDPACGSGLQNVVRAVMCLSYSVFVGWPVDTPTGAPASYCRVTE